MSDAYVAQWLEQSTGNRKTWARIPAQSKASFFHRKISNSSNLKLICMYLRYKSLKLSTRTPVGNVSYLIRDYPGAKFGRLPELDYRATVGPTLATIVGPTVAVSVLPTLAANTGNQRCARPSAQLWPRLELTVGPTLANSFR